MASIDYPHEIIKRLAIRDLRFYTDYLSCSLPSDRKEIKIDTPMVQSFFEALCESAQKVEITAFNQASPKSFFFAWLKNQAEDFLERLPKGGEC